MASPSFIKTMIEALRTKPNPERRVYKDGQLYRTEPVPEQGMGGMQHKVQYDRYRKIQNDAGETPVSYEEWLQNR